MPKGQRTETLTLEAIVDESERIARTQGVDGLTMRAVAAGLGVTPMAIYYYVAGQGGPSAPRRGPGLRFLRAVAPRRRPGLAGSVDGTTCSTFGRASGGIRG